MYIAVILPTRGRSQLAEWCVTSLRSQTRKPDLIIVCGVSKSDLPQIVPMEGLELMLGRPGSSAQRNEALDALGDRADVVIFFDDDFLPQSDWLKNAEEMLNANPGIIGFEGVVISDGANGPGIEPNLAERMVAEAVLPSIRRVKEVKHLYGCNMGFRADSIVGMRFDENMPGYGWMEDRDFSVIARRRGKLAKVNSLIGVHLGVKFGRTRGDLLGISQMRNPIYLVKKGSLSLTSAISVMSRLLLKNAVMSIFPEFYIDRRGRLRGNIRALFSMIMSRLHSNNH